MHSKKSNLRKCDNNEIKTSILEEKVYKLFREEVVKPETLKKHMDIFKSDGRASQMRLHLRSMNKRVNREKFEKQLTGLDTQIRDTVIKKTRITDLYASGDLSKEEYLKRIAQYDTEAMSLKGKKSELQTRVPVVIKQADVANALTQYCELAKKEFEQAVDTETKRRFLLNFVEKITYRNDRVTVQGFIPVDSSKIEFVLKRTIDREKLREEVLQKDRKVGRIGSPVRRDFFGKLLAEAKVISPKV